MEFTLDISGSVIKSKLLISIGRQDIHALVMKSLKIARPLPPLLENFGVKTYTTGRIIHFGGGGFAVK